MTRGVLLLLSLRASTTAATDCSKQPNATDCSALAALGTALGHTNWKNRFGWLSDAPICSWYGITCSDQGRVHAIDLSYNGIDGFIPPEIGELTELTSLNLNGSRPESYTGCAEQNLHGTGFPESFWKLIRLRDLNAEYCCLGGTLSPRIGQLKELRTLALHSNYIHGPIPQTVGALTKLEVFKLGRNPFSGGFPNVANLHNLTKLSSNFCALTGPIPDIFDNLPHLEMLYFDGNGLTGSLPPSVGKLRKLWTFSFNINQLTGTPSPSPFD